MGSREGGRSRRFRHDSWNQSYNARHARIVKEISISFKTLGRAHLTGNTLNHRLSFLLRVVRPSTPAELRAEVAAVPILFVESLLCRVQRARVGEGSGWAVTLEGALWEELELLMVGVACDGTGGADAAG